MKVEKETIVILFLIAIVLGPMWFFAFESVSSETPVALSQEEGKIAPTEKFIPSPVEVNEFIAGVITWVALFALVGMIYYTHQFVRTVGQAEEPVATDQSEESVAADGGIRASLPSYFLTDERWLADYWPAQFSTPGMIGIFVMAWSSVVFALLFIMEAMTWARTQYLGVYGGMMFLSLGVFVAVYTIWFLPSARLVEDRGHEEKITEKGGNKNQ